MVMDILASSSNSSIDLLSTAHDDPRSSPVRDLDRLLQRSSSPFKNVRATPTRNKTYQLQDFYLATPTESRNISLSPTRSLAEAENVISPWRIRVRVEAEREGTMLDPEIDYQPRRSMSPYKTRSRAATMVVPLNDYSDPNTTPRRSERVRKSTPKRRPTPKPSGSRKRVLESVENEASSRLPTPKRLKQSSSVESDHNEEAPMEDEETVMLHLDDLVEAAVIGSGDQHLDIVEEADTETSTRTAVSITTTAQGTTEQLRPSRTQRTTSPFKFRRQGQENSDTQTVSPASRQARSRRRLLISDFAEPRQEFDSVVEGEDFSMVSLSSVPSAQQHLSLRKTNSKAINTITGATNSSRDGSELQSQTASPTVVLQSGVPQPQDPEQHLGDIAAASSTTKPPSPIATPPRSLKYPKLRSDIDSTPKSRDRREHNRSGGIPNANTRSNDVVDDDIQVALPQALEEDIPAEIADAEDFGFEEDSDQPGVILPETFDLDAVDEEPVDSDQGSPQFMEQKINQPYIEEDDSADDNVQVRSPKTREQEPASHVDFKDRPSRITESKPDKSNNIENRSYLEQSSMLQLPQTRDAPSRLFSSPTLPNMILQQDKSNIQKKIITPKLKRVVKAGKALQGVVEPVIEQQAQATPNVIVSKTQDDDLFSGFSISTRRELRAGLRLGNELAKRQSSLMDITMHTVSSQDHPTEALPRADANISHQKSPRTQNIDPIERDVSSVRIIRKNTQLPSPEDSSNSTENKADSLLSYVSNPYDNEKPTHDARHRSVVHPDNMSDKVVENDIVQEADNVDFQDQGFATDSEPEAHNLLNELTDIWQLAADSTSFLQDPVSQRTPTIKQPDTLDIGTDRQQSLLGDSVDKAGDTESVLHHSLSDDFDDEPVGTPAAVHPPTTLSDMLTPSDTDSSLQKDRRHNQVEFTDFTGFTKDLLQAAANRDRRHMISNRISEEHEEQTTPSDKILQTHRPYPANVFTTKSFLETSPGSVRSKRFSPRRPISFRPTNRKESWLFDPSWLRKPPSPSKEVQPVSKSPSLQSDSTDPASSESHDSNPKQAQISEVDNSGSSLSGQSSSDIQQEDSSLTYQGRESSDQRFPPKLRAPTSQKGRDKYSPDIQTSTPIHEPPRTLPVNNNLTKPMTRTLPAQNLPQKARTETRNPPIQHSSVSQSSEANSQQSSFISNVSSNTSYDGDEPQTSWLSILATMATPLITSTKAFTNLAATAFRQSQHQTFYPTRKPASSTPAILTTHMPFNDAHWSALRILYTKALEEPRRFSLDLMDPCADYLGLEIESMGWKRELDEWELAVVAEFVQLLDKEGVVEDEEEDDIDVEDVVKRVFSVWVGMVTRGELEITDGVAGAWDRRFVSRRDAVLEKQREWLRTHQ